MLSAKIEKIDLETLQKLGNLELIARYVVEGFITGLHKSPFHGFSVEFAEHRLYNTGESIKHLDWKVYGRTDRLYVKKYEEETNLRCQIIIDTSSSMYFPDKNYNKLIFSLYASAALINLLKKQRDASGITLFSDRIEHFIPAKSNIAHIQYLYDLLNKKMQEENKQVKTATSEVLHIMAESIRKRSLVILFSDMFDNIHEESEIFSGLQHLKFNKHEVILFHVFDESKELHFDYKNKAYQFIDLESGEKVNLFPEEIRKEYQKKSKAFRERLQSKCSQYHIDFVDVDINNGFYQVLQSYLLKRKRLY
jgi:uncharacterized protein (DUF58 family)